MKNTFRRNNKHTLALLVTILFLAAGLFIHFNYYYAVLAGVGILILLILLCGYRINRRHELLGGPRISIRRIHRVEEKKNSVIVYYIQGVACKLAEAVFYPHDKKGFIHRLHEINPKIECIEFDR